MKQLIQLLITKITCLHTWSTHREVRYFKKKEVFWEKDTEAGASVMIVCEKCGKVKVVEV